MEKEIEYLILDLGGVLYDLDYTATEQAFVDLGFEMQFSRVKQAPIIDGFEEGKVSEYEFFRYFEQQINAEGIQEELRAAWNKMLLGIKADKLDLLKQLKKKYQLFLYSNTNETHIRAVYEHLADVHGVTNFSAYFDGFYLSNEMGIRKPKAEGFLHLVKVEKMDPAKTLFIDDSPQHAKGARLAGIQAEWLNLEEEDIFQLLHRKGL